jgi:GH24 family phage-related lysozyme (muramidase)
MRAYKDDNGQSRIGKGATMHDIGRSHAQVERYIDSLLSLMDFAQKNDCDVVWG